ncbi:MAG: FAD-binding oxidoreductase [Acidimicrobiales bacterium]
MTDMEMTGEPRPLSAAHDRALVDFAAEIGETDPVAVEGARTRWQAGGDPAAGTRLVQAPRGILEHRPEEMTVRVRAGTTVEELHAEIGTRGQRTALPERGGTIGGALAVGENGVAVLGRGRIRDVVLQVRYVSAEGRVVTGGGPTVKNVSGFDLPRLLVGSLGTIGLIGEVLLRTNPVPAVSAWLHSVDADPFTVVMAILKPSAVLWDGTSTWVEIEGHATDVDAQRKALAGVGTWDDAIGPPDLAAHRWSLPPKELRRIDPGTFGPFVACIGVGTVFCARPQPKHRTEPALATLAARVKIQFDPTGRLNPGRSVEGTA